MTFKAGVENSPLKAYIIGIEHLGKGQLHVG